MKLFILGAYGYLGSSVAVDDRITSRFERIVLIDSQEKKVPDGLNHALMVQRERYHVVPQDLTSIESTRRIADMVTSDDVVLLFAALAQMDNTSVFQHNVTITRNVAVALSQSGALLVFPSSTSVYQSCDGDVSETLDLSVTPPTTPYSQCKLTEESIIRSYSERFLIFRLATVSGVSPSINFNTAVNKFCLSAHERIPFTLWRSASNQSKPYLSLLDFRTALGALFDGNLDINRTYNLVSFHASIEQIRNMIWSVSGYCETVTIDGPAIPNKSQFVDTSLIKSYGIKPPNIKLN